MQKQNLTQKFIPVTASILAPACLAATCVGSYAQVPTTARITQPATFRPSMTIHSGKTKPAEASADSTLNWENSLWVPNDGSGARATLRFRDQSGRDMKLKVDAIAQNGLTKYKMPCQTILSGKSVVVITWEDGKSRGCSKGIDVTSKDKKIVQQLFPQNMFLAQKDKSIPNVNPDTSRWNPKALLKAQTDGADIRPKALLKAQADGADIRYYCSALPASGGGSAGMAAGFNSAEEACNQATQKCLKNNGGSECSIETMGEWSVNDPELMTSVTCQDGKVSEKKVRGSDIRDPDSSNNTMVDYLLGQLGELGKIINIFIKPKPGNCVLEMYHPDEVLISPLSSQQTVVQAKDEGNGSVQVQVQEGQALLRSTQSPKGIVASPGRSYLFDGQGVINQGTVPNPNPTPGYAPPTPAPLPTPSP